MMLKERAKVFAIKAHKDQVRKSEPDKPMIMHSIGVGNLLEEYGYSDEIISAGYLHDVVEDTDYTINDIELEFGSEVVGLVQTATELDKSLSWEERKKHTIEITKNLPLANKVIICADKINNLEDLNINFQKTNQRDFKAFKKGEEDQKWYYTSIYESLIYKEDKNLPLFQRLKEIIDIIFYGKEDLYLKDTIFLDDKEYYEKLKKLHAQKMELQKLKQLCSLKKPFVIEFSGTPRTGKTTLINNLADFFKKGGFDVAIIEEFTTSKYYKEKLKKELSKISLEQLHKVIIENVHQQLLEALNMNKEIIIIDRSINDRQIWNYRRYLNKDMSKEVYESLKEKYSTISKELIDFLVITYADSLISLKRDYLSSLALERRNFLNIANIEDYNNSLKKIEKFLEESVQGSCFIDTTSLNLDDVSVMVAEKIMILMRDKYIKAFKESIKINEK